jgi:hypothetical protein
MIEQLNPGDTLLIEAIKVKGGKVQLHFAEPLEQEEGREINLLAAFNAGDQRFSGGPKARHCWYTVEPAAASVLLDINLGDDAKWGINDSGKEVLELNILNPQVMGRRMRVQITETVTPPSDWDEENIDRASKRRGKDGDFITHQGYHIFTTTTMVLNTPKHTFLEADKAESKTRQPILRDNKLNFPELGGQIMS